MSSPDSSTVFVSSSTNSGTPSVLATICSSTSGGKAFPPLTWLGELRAPPAVEPIQRERRDMRLPDPGRGEFGAIGDEQQHGQLRDARDQQIEHLLGGGVYPVRVFEHDEQRLPRGQADDQLAERFERLFLLLLRRDVQRRVTPGRQGEQRREQRRNGGKPAPAPLPL